MNIKDIIKMFPSNPNLPVTVVTRKIVKPKDSLYIFEKSFPKKNVCITHCYDYGGRYRVDYVDRTGNRNVTMLPPEFEVTLAEGAMKESILKAFNKYRVANIQQFIQESLGGYVGSDPEIFVVDDKDQLIPAFNFLDKKGGETKTDQDQNGEKHGVYWDGFQAEFETGPRACLAYHVDTVQLGLKAVLEYARKYNPKAKLSLATVMEVSEQLRRDSKPEHVALGCMPSFNAYGIETVIPNGADLPFRSTGGHIHFGIGKRTKEEYERMVKAMDAIIGVACVSLFAGHDVPARRAFYGLPGEYRTPAHGLEYRTLSNAWLSHPMINHLVFDMARRCLIIGKHDLLNTMWKHTEEETIRIIRECDVEGARKVLTDNKDAFMSVIKAAYDRNGIDPKYHEIIYNIFMNGMGSVIKDVHDIEGNWHLTDGKWVTHTGNNNATISSFIYNFKLNKEKEERQSA